MPCAFFRIAVKFGKLSSFFHCKYLSVTFGTLFHRLVFGSEHLFQALFSPFLPHPFLVLNNIGHIYFTIFGPSSLGHNTRGIGTVNGRSILHQDPEQ
uniref:Uncharacterized protein n=1 Tax=Macaca fascicularis TaxID=9541 RepID=Q9GM35_MACFA|nr:hypothetical protein [Macaca fascicularis]